MAKASKKTAEVTYVLEMSKREANALCELLLAANHFEGEGDVLADLYDVLCGQGAESDQVSHTIEDDEVVVSR